MARYVIAPDNPPAWAAYATGQIGLPLGSELELHTLAPGGALGPSDLAALGALQPVSEATPEGDTVLDYVIAIYDGLEAYFEAMGAI